VCICIISVCVVFILKKESCACVESSYFALSAFGLFHMLFEFVSFCIAL